MQFTTAFITAILAFTATALPQAPAAPAAPAQGGAALDRATVEGLVPDFGVPAGLNPDGSGNCETPIAKQTKIACDCPPPRDQYITSLTDAVNAGNTFGLPANFPTGQDDQSNIVRLQTMLAVMQNIKGQKGVGCPAISTKFKQELDRLTGAAPAANAG